MTVWQILGIEPTSDQRAIKKAYAKQLKQIDQENDPQAFIQLREALHQAQYEAEYLDEESDEEDIFAATQPDENPIEIQATPEIPDFDVRQHIETLYHEFVTALQQQDSRYRISEALYTLNMYMQDVDTETQQYYRDELLTLLQQYDLQQLKYIVHIEQDEPDEQSSVQVDVNTPETWQQDDNDHILDHQVAQEGFTHADSGQNRPFQNKSNPDQSWHDAFVEDSSSALKQTYDAQALAQRINQLIQAIDQQQFDEHSYQLFAAILDEIPQCSLSEQIDYKDQLEYALGHVEVEDYHEQFGQFIQLWNIYYPSEDDCLDQSYYHYRIQHYVEFYEKQQRLHQSVPENLQPVLQTLTENQDFQPFAMLGLQAQLKRKYSKDFVEDFYQQLDIKAKDQNANFIYLNTINEWKNALWSMIVWGMATIFYCSSQFALSAVTKIYIALGCIFWFMLVQSPIKAFLLGHEKRDDYLLRLNQLWFISGLILCATGHLLNDFIHQTLTYGWILFTLIIFSCAQHFIYQPLKNLLLQRCQIHADPWVMGIVSCIFAFGLLALYSHQFDPQSIWLMSYSLIPMGFIIFHQYFYSMYVTFGYQLKAPEQTEHADEEQSEKADLNQRIKQKLAHVFAILLRGVWVWLMIYLFVDTPVNQYDFYLCMLSFLSILIVSIQPTKIAGLLKYLCYITLIIGTLYTVVFPLVACFLLFRTAQEDYRERKANMA